MFSLFTNCFLFVFLVNARSHRSLDQFLDTSFNGFDTKMLNFGDYQSMLLFGAFGSTKIIFYMRNA